jgi:catechol 2,3-dioxygenase-like lactoylglutathione lyase family enzyme
MRFTLKFELAAADLARAMAWYSEVLDLEPTDPDGEALVYRVGGTVFGIYPSENAGLSKGVVFEEYDFGPDFGTVDGVLTSPDGEKTSWFKDSEGNTLALGSSL